MNYVFQRQLNMVPVQKNHGVHEIVLFVLLFDRTFDEDKGGATVALCVAMLRRRYHDPMQMAFMRKAFTLTAVSLLFQ